MGLFFLWGIAEVAQKFPNERDMLFVRDFLMVNAERQLTQFCCGGWLCCFQIGGLVAMLAAFYFLSQGWAMATFSPFYILFHFIIISQGVAMTLEESSEHRPGPIGRAILNTNHNN